MPQDEAQTGIPQSNILDLRQQAKPRVPPPPPEVKAKPVKLRQAKPWLGVNLPRFAWPKLTRPALTWPRLSQAGRSVAVFSLAGLLIISPLFFFNSLRRAWSVKQAVLGASTEAYGYLQVAKDEAGAFYFSIAHPTT